MNNRRMNVEVNNRWDELAPEIQLALIRLINHIASMPNQRGCFDAIALDPTVFGKGESGA